jgi:tetratricopeptide (TPR) repeat protein
LQRTRPRTAADRPRLLPREWLAPLALAGLTVALFYPATRYPFVNYDDPDYVTKNEHVTAGLSATGVGWAFTTFRSSNWHPLTWLSLQLDASLSRTPDGVPEPFGFHLTSVLLHAANAALLFLALRALTGEFWRSAVVALLFAVHPLRVESVAWVSERKDVLSVFFGLLALWAYADYVKRPSPWRYLAVATAFAASLLSKPMLVTLPCLLLVLDWWPLGRVRSLADWRRPAVEKLPLLALAAALSALTYFVQARAGTVMGLETFPLSVRAENAAVSYVQYVVKTAWPFGLAVYYPHPASPWGAGLSAWKVGGAAVLLLAATGGAVVLRRRAPYLLAGWLWYLGTLVPVIGLLQVGDQAYADRYSYFPQVGILIALCWGVADLARRHAETAAAAAAAVALAFAVATGVQLATWRDSTSLWQHDLRSAGPSPLAYMNLGAALGEAGNAAGSEEALREAIKIDRNAVLAHINLGDLLLRQGDLQGAAGEFQTACEVKPDYAQPYTQLGDVLCRLGRLDEAAKLHEKAIELAPELAGAWCNLGLVEMARKNKHIAAACFDRALELQPDLAEAHCGVGQLHLLDGDRGPGLDQLRQAIRCNPRFGEGHLILGIALDKMGDPSCVGHFEKAVRYSPGVAEAWFQLGRARAGQGHWQEAADCLERAAKLDPARKDYRAALASARKRVGAGPPLPTPGPGATP